MSNGSQKQLASRRQAVEEWLALAAENARAAVLLAGEEALQKQALYFTQQSMEAASKGLASGVGESHAKIRKSGHNNVNLLISVLDTIEKDTQAAPYIDSLFAGMHVKGKPYNTVEQIQNMHVLSGRPENTEERKKDAEKFFEDMLRASAETVEATLNLVTNMDSIFDAPLTSSTLVSRITSAPFRLKMPPSNDDLGRTLGLQIHAEVVRRMRGYKNTRTQLLYMRGLVIKMMTGMIEIMGAERFRLDVEKAGNQYLFTKENLARVYDTSKAYMRLLLIGSLVWPHESYPRYVAPPGNDRFEATPKQGLGTRHYTEAVGVIRHIKDITAEAQRMTTILEERYASGALFPYLRIAT